MIQDSFSLYTNSLSVELETTQQYIYSTMNKIPSKYNKHFNMTCGVQFLFSFHG